MALEETANSIEDHLIEGLSFKLNPGASYVQSRRSVSFFPQGGNSYSSTGVKVIKIFHYWCPGRMARPINFICNVHGKQSFSWCCYYCQSTFSIGSVVLL